MAKYEAKTTQTSLRPADYIASLEDGPRKQDAEILLPWFESVTGLEACMWGPSIIGFGRYAYTYDSGHSGEFMLTGFSPRKANLVIYVADFPGKAGLLKSLGKHKGGLEQCLYINKLADVDLEVLRRILEEGLAQTAKQWPVTPS